MSELDQPKIDDNELPKIERWEELISYRQSVEDCHSGPSCWCALILVEGVVDEYGDPIHVTAYGDMPRVVAEHIVKLHNDFL